jgi:Domain of unknown function (DUF4440)
MQILSVKILLLTLLTSSIATFAQNGQPELFKTMQALDTQLFEAANHCDYEKLTAMVDENLEFYHDQAGLMLGRQAFLETIKNNTCGTMIRELMPGTLQVYPIKGYGAMELGVHRFHHPGHEKEFPAARQLGMTRFLDPGAAEWPAGEAKFLQIWQLKDGIWKLTRVVSYDH